MEGRKEKIKIRSKGEDKIDRSKCGNGLKGRKVEKEVKIERKE